MCIPQCLFGAFALAGLGLLTACGDAEVPAPMPVRWMESKPNPIVGSLRAAVVERLGPDRVRIEARWTGIGGRQGCAIDLLLPRGTIVLEGPERIDLPRDEPSGEASWVLEFPLGTGALDAVVRYCVSTSEGMRAAQCAVRLTP